MDNISTAMTLLKLDLGILHNDMDGYLTSRLEAAAREIERTGIALDTSDQDDLLLAVDYAAWLYRKRDTAHDMPRHLQYRLHCRLLAEKAGKA